MEATVEQKPKPPRKKKPKRHPMLAWIIKAGIASELFGWGGLLISGWFVISTVLIYLGFLLFGIDLWFEPELAPKLGWRIVGTAVIVASAIAFSIGVVFVKAPLLASAEMTDGTYPAGTKIAEILWRPEYTEVDVYIRNPSDRPYDDLDVVMRTNSPIAAIAQKGNACPGASFEDRNDYSNHLLDVNGKTGERTALPVVVLATDAGYRMRCAHLPANTTITVVIAMADLKWGGCATSGNPEKTLLDGCPIRIKFEDYSSYWIGLPGRDVFTPRPSSSDAVKVDKNYTVMYRRRSETQRIPIGGLQLSR
jgi:hypothetical protein